MSKSLKNLTTRVPVEDAIEACLLGPLASLLHTSYVDVIGDRLSEYVVSLLDLGDGRLRKGWSSLDQPVQRTKDIFNFDNLANRLVTRLMKEKKSIENAVICAGQRTRSSSKFATHLSVVAPDLLNQPAFNALLATNPFPRAWARVADRLATDAQNAILGSPTVPNHELHNRLLFAGFFWDCDLDSAELVESALEEICFSMTGVRGSLVRLVEKLSPSGVADAIVRTSTRKAPLVLQHAGLSDLLDQTAKESARMAAGQGVVAQIVRRTPVHVPPSLGHLVSARRIEQARPFMCAQYECTILAYMALSSIEQLARAWAESRGTHHLGPNGRPKGLPDIVATLPCSPRLTALLGELYEPSGGNIRNRIMHGGLLEVESKQMEILQGFAQSPVKHPVRRPLHPENICHLCLECLEALDVEAAADAKITKAHLSWTSSMWPSPQDVQLGNQISCNFLTSEEVIRKTWTQLERYLKAVAPHAAKFVKIGFIGWLRRPTADSLVQFMAMTMVFEAAYRATLQLLDVPILQVQSNGSRVQYRMLDKRQLCTPVELDKLVDGLSLADKVAAKRVLSIAVDIRDGLAHGALTDFDAYSAEGLGHLVLKANQGLEFAGINAMTRLAAYYRWTNGSGDDADANWFAAQLDLIEQMKDFASN